MSTVNKELLNEILRLPSNLRSQLIEELIKSLNVPIQPEIDQIWAEEAEKRVQAIQSGKITLIDGEEVINQMRKRIEK
ncbi:MAG: addiction module protein [Promethearchaeota archaeon]